MADDDHKDKAEPKPGAGHDPITYRVVADSGAPVESLITAFADQVLSLPIVASTATVGISFGAYAADHGSIQKPAKDHEIYSLVGRVASDWAHVEHTLDLIIWELARIKGDEGACITAQLTGVAPRCKTIIAQLTLFGRTSHVDTQSAIKRTTDIMNKSSGPGDKRNRIVHDPWYVYTQSNATAQFKAMPPKDLRYGIHPVDRNDIEAALKEIGEFSARVSALKIEISAMLETSRGKPRAP
jgi:hypothetical protein